MYFHNFAHDKHLTNISALFYYKQINNSKLNLKIEICIDFQHYCFKISNVIIYYNLINIIVNALMVIGIGIDTMELELELE